MKALPKPFTSLVLLSGMALAPASQATLYTRLGGLAVYDDDRNITWLADANYAKTSGYDTDGAMTWQVAKGWVAGLNVGGYTGWRLPTALNENGSGPCLDYNCGSSELSHLFYELGGVFFQSILTTHNSNFNLFTNVQDSNFWTGKEYMITDEAYFIPKLWLPVLPTFKYEGLYSWAVRSGDVAAVPEPGVMGLLGIGALAWAGARHKRRG